MKDFLVGLMVFVFATAVSVFLVPVLTAYALGYSIYWSVKYKSVKSFFKFWLKTIDGILSGIGYMLYHLGYGWDLIWNAEGEMLEDLITAEESTTFGDKNVTVSASVGKLEIDKKLNKYGIFSSKALNFIFWQKAHAVDSWLFQKAKKELRDKYFNKLEIS